MIDTGTALAVMPKNELALVAKQAGDRVERLRKADTGCLIGGLSGAGFILGGAVALTAAPVVAPVLIGVGLVSLFGCMVTSVGFLDSKIAKAKAQQTKAIAARVRRLRETAQNALEEAVRLDTIRIWLDLPIAPQDETPKKVRVIDMKTIIIDADGKKTLSLCGWILEEDAADIEWLKGYSTTVSLEQSVAAFPKAAIESIRTAIPPTEAASAAEPQAQPPAIRKPKKNLPRGPITHYRGPT